MEAKKIIFILGIILLALAIIALFLIFFMNAFNQTSQNKANETIKLAECIKDEDCAKVQTTCCSCSMGGTDKCVSLVMEKIYKTNMQACPSPEKLICAAFYNCNIQSCSCVDGMCTDNE